MDSDQRCWRASKIQNLSILIFQLKLFKTLMSLQIVCSDSVPAFSQSKEISSDLCCFYGGGVSHNEDIMHSFQKFIVVPFPTILPL